MERPKRAAASGVAAALLACLPPQQRIKGGVAGLAMAFLSIWIVRHSFIKWAEKQAEHWPFGKNLGFPSDDMKIDEMGTTSTLLIESGES
ncbi:hypothetical protein NDU88_002953 [Pleurodeles waltl]|uniref:Uncharacterized protein n=1 Tax=Pleurodeles waltl TaxID=8319 RepID=A0AAV7NJD3_PLEWA|nr:hypothetical protein NDU88_002953 [Pleurodeles waltl]